MDSSESIHEAVEYPCHLCQYTSSFKLNLLKHIKFDHSITRYHCYHCEYRATDRDTLLAHKETKHNKMVMKRMSYSCDKCDYIGSYKKLLRHVKWNHEKILYERDDKAPPKSSEKLLNHDYKAPKSSEKRLNHDDRADDKASKTPKKLLNHDDKADDKSPKSQKKLLNHEDKADNKIFLIKHAQSKQVKYTCDECGYETTHKESFDSHVQSQHDGVVYSCNRCEYKAVSSDALWKHEKSKHLLSMVKYSCANCDFKAKTSFGLRSHMKWHSQHNTMKQCFGKHLELKPDTSL